jgi:serine/threonine protein kinase
MGLAVGTRLGPYEILSTIGAGGMGEVYKARDTRLDRSVAIKICSHEISNRFEREARAISALNHPHVCTLFDIGPNYLVMELVEGESLAARLKKSPLATPLVLRYGSQIADALAAAHSRGIIHRDLKPANIMVTKTGVKVLDFGVAALSPDFVVTAERSEPLTAPHTTVGTLAYMAPEQLDGRECDARSDIFALGLVLYEMSTGRRAFPANSHAALVGQVMRCEPAPMTNVSPQFAHIVERCLARDPDGRWESAKDVRLELEWAAKQSGPEQVAPSTTSSRLWPWAVVAVAGAMLAMVAFAVFRRPTPALVPVRLSLSFEGLSGEVGAPVPSPDGKNFVFPAFDPSGRRSLWLRPLDSELARRLPTTEDAVQPFWSPDGRWIGFFAQEKLKRIRLSGENAETIGEVKSIATGLAIGAVSNQAGDIILSGGNRSPLFRVRASGGPMQQLTRLDSSRAENSHRFPAFLPDGRHFLFVARSNQRANDALYLGSLDSGETRRVMTVQSNVSYVPGRDGGSGLLLFIRDGTLVQQAFDGEQPTGESVPIVENVEYQAASLYGAFAASGDGTVLIFRPAPSGRTELRWFDRRGNAAGTLGPAGDYGQPRISPEGGRVLFSRPDERTGNRDVWYIETARGITARMTTDPANDWWPVWSPNGRSILFASDRGGGPQFAIFIKRSMDPGSGEAQLFQFQGSALPEDWSHDGKWIVFATNSGSSATDLWVVPTSGSAPFAFLAPPLRRTARASRLTADGSPIHRTRQDAMRSTYGRLLEHPQLLRARSRFRARAATSPSGSQTVRPCFFSAPT